MASISTSTTKLVLHYPRLDTVMMVEDAIRNASDYPTKHSLWRSLPKQVQYQTLCYILDYLEEIGKIVIKNGQLIWVWDPAGIKKVLSKPNLIVRSSSVD